VVMASIALGGAAAAAWSLCGAGGAIVHGSVRVLPEWPVRLTLPNGYTCVAMGDPGEPTSYSYSPRGLAAEAVFIDGNVRGARAKLSLSYWVLDDETTLEDALLKFSDFHIDQSDDIQVGPLTGRLVVMPDALGGPAVLIAVAVLPEGLVLRLTHQSSSFSHRGAAEFRSICESVHFVDWAVADPLLGGLAYD